MNINYYSILCEKIYAGFDNQEVVMIEFYLFAS